VTIASGFAGYNIWLFVLCSIIARGGRFFVVAILLNRYGEWIRVRIRAASDRCGWRCLRSSSCSVSSSRFGCSKARVV